MKCVYHKQNKAYRVQQRGKLFFVQHTNGLLGTREADPWSDIGKPKDSLDEATSAMYVFKPLVKP